MDGKSKRRRGEKDTLWTRASRIYGAVNYLEGGRGRGASIWWPTAGALSTEPLLPRGFKTKKETRNDLFSTCLLSSREHRSKTHTRVVKQLLTWTDDSWTYLKQKTTVVENVGYTFVKIMECLIKIEVKDNQACLKLQFRKIMLYWWILYFSFKKRSGCNFR